MEATENMNKNTFDVKTIREDFPILSIQLNNHPLVYFDSAATTQKPKSVIDAMTEYYYTTNANVHRGVHSLSERATELFEQARADIQHFIHAADKREIVFVKGATEGVNLVANSFVLENLSPGDEILITEMEHHSNIVPWQLIAEKADATIRVAPINDKGEVIMEEFKAMLTDKVKFCAICHISNALGTINPVKEMIALAHEKDVPVLIDGAQATPHMSVNVTDLDCEFYVFSSHKMYGPTGIGVLYAKGEYLEVMRPYQGGGEMITHVAFDYTEYNEYPYKFEAGTPHIAGAIGLAAAIRYITHLGLSKIQEYENELLEYTTEKLQAIPGVHIIGTADNKASIVSFKLDEVHAHDVGTVLNNRGIALRVGHHCAIPVMDHFNVPATARVSLSFYNTKEEIDLLHDVVLEVKKVFG